MEIRVLGPLEVSAGGQALDLGGPKQRAVLAMLLIEAGRPVSLGRIIDGIWGDEPPARAEVSVQSYVSKLRRLLEPGRGPRRPAQVIATEATGYVLRAGAVEVDATRFEAGAREGHTLLEAGRPGAARARLAEALSLWRGGAWEEFADATFARAEAARLEEMRLLAEEDRLHAEIDVGAHASAASELEALTTGHPLRERLWELRMLALYRSGRQAEALRVYQAARGVLAEELGIDPGPALRELEAAILAHDPRLQWVPRMEPAFPAPEACGRGAARWPLVGREQERAQLGAALAEALAGRGEVVLVSGEAGIGKTRLVEDLAGEASDRGLTVAWGTAQEGETAPAFWPWVAVLRTVADAVGSAHLDLTSLPGAAELSQVVPALGAPAAGSGPAVAADPETARYRLFEAVASLLGRAAQQRPLVVVLDDLHWADVASLQLLGFVGATVGHSRLLLVGTYRPTDVGRDHPLTAVLGGLTRHQIVRRIALEGLGPQDTAALAEAVVASAAGDLAPDGGELHARTAGNPFFVTEVARLAAQDGDGRSEAVRRVPAGIRDVVRQRLARLPEEATGVLALAAVAGRVFDLALIYEAGDLDLDAAVEALEAALASGFVAETGDVAGRYRFSHDLVREAIVEDLGGARRARLHARLGHALEVVAADHDERAVEIADHFFQASVVALGEKAVSWALRASEVAVRRLAFEQAAGQLKRALSVTRRSPAGPARDRLELDVLVRLSLLLEMTEGYAAPDVGETLRRARRLCEQVGDDRNLVPVLWRLGAFHMVSADLEAAHRVCDELLVVAARSGVEADLVAAHHGLGVTCLQQGELQAACEHFEAAMGLTTGLHDPWLASWLPQHPVVSCDTFLAWASWLRGDGERARALAREALVVAEEQGRDFSVVHALLFDAWLAGWAGEIDLALAQAQAVIALSESRGFRLYGAMGRVVEGWASATRPGASVADAAAGIDGIRLGMDDMRATGAWMLQGFFLGLLADSLLRQRRVVEARAALDEGRTITQRTGEQFYAPELDRLRAAVALASEPPAPAAAAVHLQDGLDAARHMGARWLEARVVADLAALDRRTGLSDLSDLVEGAAGPPHH